MPPYPRGNLQSPLTGNKHARKSMINVPAPSSPPTTADDLHGLMPCSMDNIAVINHPSRPRQRIRRFHETDPQTEPFISCLFLLGETMFRIRVALRLDRAILLGSCRVRRQKVENFRRD